ncbi:SpoIID/LytB domain-containing protein [Geminocystis sp. GBBB08]|uniref:SpoIID/LytB domain-containing protein n=1 Tax=Geminocystis sp. GBBB08 TaxID=2604140 RepID=UPI0027E30F0A|nr:SpoIID/LytB domain-containing protein [Geminocystis sp. GBBB08]MBL1208809.1 SpoIID/LytB domain-containing protein [Geminocystis sp. GBBB08]
MKFNNQYHFKILPLTSVQVWFALPLLLVFSLFYHTFPVLAVDLKVGIVQRFGDELEDEITLKSTQGDSLTVKFTNLSTQEEKTLTTNELKLSMTPKPLPNKIIEERLILGDHGTFETAENDAQRWQSLGIDVEITQPGRWQVWAKRSTYSTPLLKRLLLKGIEEKGYKDVYIETTILLEKPVVSFKVGENTYQASYLEIDSNRDIIQVKDGIKGTWRSYGGNFTLQPNSYGDYTLVNKVDLETYLRGVVPHEIGSNVPLAAAEAQTIIARTYALRNTRRFQADNYEMCATTHCQVYYGLTGTSPISDQAIAKTKGLVLTYNNELVDALYSSTTGGVTSYFEDVWNGENRPYLKSVIDSPQQVWNLGENTLESEANFRNFIALQKGFNETGRSLFRWNRKSSLENLTKDLQKYLKRTKHPLQDFNTIQEMKIIERSPSGRVIKLDITTDLGVVSLAKNEVRSAFTPPRSTLFYLEPFYDKNKKLAGYAFIGGGFGHGVGLSQFGSYNLAYLGWSAQKILEFYYPGTKLEPLNKSIIFWQPSQ